MSVYYKDNCEYLEMALKSIWHVQSLKPNQIVIVKDGPLSAELNNIIEAWESKISDVIKVVPLKINKGLRQALRKQQRNHPGRQALSPRATLTDAEEPCHLHPMES